MLFPHKISGKCLLRMAELTEAWNWNGGFPFSCDTRRGVWTSLVNWLPHEMWHSCSWDLSRNVFKTGKERKFLSDVKAFSRLQHLKKGKKHCQKMQKNVENSPICFYFIGSLPLYQSKVLWEYHLSGKLLAGPIHWNRLWSDYGGILGLKYVEDRPGEKTAPFYSV